MLWYNNIQRTFEMAKNWCKVLGITEKPYIGGAYAQLLGASNPVSRYDHQNNAGTFICTGVRVPDTGQTTLATGVYFSVSGKRFYQNSSPVPLQFALQTTDPEFDWMGGIVVQAGEYLTAQFELTTFSDVNKGVFFEGVFLPQGVPVPQDFLSPFWMSFQNSGNFSGYNSQTQTMEAQTELYTYACTGVPTGASKLQIFTNSYNIFESQIVGVDQIPTQYRQNGSKLMRSLSTSDKLRVDWDLPSSANPKTVFMCARPWLMQDQQILNKK